MLSQASSAEVPTKTANPPQTVRSGRVLVYGVIEFRSKRVLQKRTKANSLGGFLLMTPDPLKLPFHRVGNCDVAAVFRSKQPKSLRRGMMSISTNRHKTLVSPL
jgi:hypothetical protein